MRCKLASFFLVCLPLCASGISAAEPAGVVTREFLYETAPFPQCHASTIVETKAGLVAAWFGGLREKDPSVGIWLSRHVEGGWTVPVEVADGNQADGSRLPCWNPVLFQPREGPLLLFYKVGPDPVRWWGMLKTSTDAGATWNAARRLPEGVLGPIKNKPVELVDGTILCPSSTESPGLGSSWRVHFELTRDLGQTWTKSAPKGAAGGVEEPNVIQPSVLVHSPSRLQAVGRSRNGRVFETWSADGGRNWGPVTLTELPNPNSGTDAVTLRDGRQLLVYNHTPKGRSPLNVAVSRDGKTWQPVLVLESEPGEYSYPACIQSRDGLVHITYTWKRTRIRHVVVDLTKVEMPAVADGKESKTYDLVIRHGQIVDGTGNPWFRGDVALKGDRIAAVGRIPADAGQREIDATGLVVAPGFIDIHSHSDTLLLEDGSAQSKIRQGVTTEVFGEGDSAGPARGKIGHGKAVVRGEPVEWDSLGKYFDTLDRAGISVNVASYVGIESVWRCVMGDAFDRPNAEQKQEMRTLVREAMAEGAMGLSSMLAMPPGSLTTTDDIVELCEEVARAGGIYSTHIRNEGTHVLAAVKEAIEIGERANVPVDIIHLKIADQKLWGHMAEIVALIDAARARGINVQAHVYPYTRGNNDLASIVPPWAHEGGTPKLVERLKDPAQRERIKRDILEGLPGWYNHYTAVGGDWGRMLISKETTYKGLTMDRVLAARAQGKTPAPVPLDSFLDYLAQEGGSVSTVYAHHTDDDMTTALVQPWCSVGSDGSAYSVEGLLRRGNPHPRSFGTFPRILGVYVRELKLLRLEDAVRKMTSLNAAKIGIRDRGTLQVGQHADVVLFDPERVIDRATYTEPFQYGEGIPYVIVNGEVVLDQGEHTGKRPGKALRRGAERAVK